MKRQGLNIYLLLLVFLLFQIPFLLFDPDSMADLNTRGAWTDEGIYSSAARNLVNGYGFDPEENTTPVRGPLQVLVQVPFFFVFGSHLVVARVISLSFLLLAMFFLGRTRHGDLMLLFFFLGGLLQFHVFQFSHYAMAEMISVSLIILALSSLLINPGRLEQQPFLPMLTSAILLASAVAMKIQFAYVLAILPLTFLLNVIATGRVERKSGWRMFFLSVAAISLVSAGLVLLWILPVFPFLSHVMGIETYGRYPETLSRIWELIRFNWNQSLRVPEIMPLVGLGILALLLLPWLRKGPGKNRIAIFFTLIWVLLELHKLPMSYLPHRYLVSMYSAIAMFVAVVFTALAGQRKRAGYVLAGLLLIVGAWNAGADLKAWQRRTNDLDEINRFVLDHAPGRGVIMGSWAPSVSWGTSLKSLVVWDIYVSPEKELPVRGTCMIVMEPDQADSDQAWGKRGIMPDSGSTGMAEFSVWRYQLQVYLYPLENSPLNDEWQ